MYRLPPRLPLSETYSGCLLMSQGQYALAPSYDTDTDVTVEKVAQGDLIVRLAIVYLGRSHQAIVPEMVAMDTGGGYNGEEAWDFLLNKSNLFPRADVIGYRHDGTDDMVTVKSLDLMYPLRALVYDSDASRTPLAQVTAVISADVQSLPPRLRQHVSIYATLDEWQKALV